MRWGIRTEVVALATACVATTGITVGGVSAWQSSAFADEARADVEQIVADDLTQTASGVHDVVATQGASTAAWWTPTSPSPSTCWRRPAVSGSTAAR